MTSSFAGEISRVFSPLKLRVIVVVVFSFYLLFFLWVCQS
jgi:hypothetical protein